MSTEIECLNHPLLDAAVVGATFPVRMESLASPPWLLDLLRVDAPAPLTTDDGVRKAVRDMLRVHGYRPSGRGKPASEYLAAAVGSESLRSINPAVDACNVVSLHAGLPISVVDADRVRLPLRIGLPPANASYVFNASGQELRLDGLPCLIDTSGPCANAVRDSERTKTRNDTTRTLSVIWGSVELNGRTEQSLAWYDELLRGLGATTERLALTAH